jgi:hypothetical protein
MSESLAITGVGLGFDRSIKVARWGAAGKGQTQEKNETKDIGKGKEKARTLKVGRIIDTTKSD